MILFKEVILNKNRNVERVPNFNKDNRHSKLLQRANKLEASLKESLSLLDSSLFISNSSSPLSPKSSELVLNRYQILNYREYLKEIYNQLKPKKLKGVSTFQLHENERQLKKFNRSIEEINQWAVNFISQEGPSIFNARNRAGRGGECVGSETNALAYGAFLERGIHGQGCLLFLSGCLFNEREISYFLKLEETSFISYALLGIFAIHANSAGISSYGDIFRKCYKDAVNLIYQAFNNVCYDSLKALALMSILVGHQSDKCLVEKISYSMLRMAYALGLDKAIVSNELGSKSPNELKIIIWKRKMWNIIMTMGSINQIVQSSYSSTAFQYDPEEFTLLNRLEAQNFENLNQSLNLTKKISSSVRLHCLEINMAILAHISKLSNLQLETLTFDQMRFPISIYLRIQSVLNNYCVWLCDFLEIEMRQYLSKERTSIEAYFCNFSNSFCKEHRSVYCIKNSASFYIFQIQLIYPLIITHPNPIEVPTLDLNIMLSSALKLDTLLLILLNLHIERIITELTQNNQTSKLTKLMKEYLKRQRFFIIDEVLIRYSRGLLSILSFDSFLYSIYSYLIVLSSKNFLEAAPCKVSFVKGRLSNLLEGLNLAKKLNKEDKFDIELALDKLSVAQKKFPTLNSFFNP